jgi:uncharacterized membrane protein YdjX (TVP38/TMEM64 family)
MCVFVYRKKLISLFKHFIEWIKVYPHAGPFAFTCITAMFVVIGGTYFLMSVSAGYAFNQVFSSKVLSFTLATFSTFLGAWLGALIAFSIGRFICRKPVQQFASKRPRIKALEIAVEK